MSFSAGILGPRGQYPGFLSDVLTAGGQIHLPVVFCVFECLLSAANGQSKYGKFYERTKGTGHLEKEIPVHLGESAVVPPQKLFLCNAQFLKI